MGLIWELLKSCANTNDYEQNKERDRLARECDMMGLDDHEKKEVMEGRQDVYDFEWDGKEETDYYNDDL